MDEVQVNDIIQTLGKKIAEQAIQIAVLEARLSGAIREIESAKSQEKSDEAS